MTLNVNKNMTDSAKNIGWDQSILASSINTLMQSLAKYDESNAPIYDYFIFYGKSTAVVYCRAEVLRVLSLLCCILIAFNLNSIITKDMNY